MWRSSDMEKNASLVATMYLNSMCFYDHSNCVLYHGMCLDCAILDSSCALNVIILLMTVLEYIQNIHKSKIMLIYTSIYKIDISVYNPVILIYSKTHTI